MKLKYETFNNCFNLCAFVNKNKIKIEKITQDEYGNWILFYWEGEK